MDNINERIIRRKKKTKWCYDSESLLITLWQNKIRELRACKRNIHIFEEIQSHMASYGFKFCIDELHSKIHNLKNRYKAEKKLIDSFGGPTTWIFFERVHAILDPSVSHSIDEETNESLERRNKTRLGWNEFSEAALLDLWPERVEELHAERKTGYIYREMADELSKLGYACSGRDVQVKLQNFTQRYRKERAALRACGGTLSTWSHYARIDRIIGNLQANTFSDLSLESIDGRKFWNKQSEKALLKVWNNHFELIRTNGATSNILLEMSTELKSMGYEFTPLELKTKMHNLTQRFRKEKQGLKKCQSPTADGWDVIKEMEKFFKPRQGNEGNVVESINNISSSVISDPLSPSHFSSVFESAAPTSSKKRSNSVSSSSSSDSSLSDTSFPAAKRRKKAFDNFFENLEQTMEKINEDMKTTIARMIAIEEEKKELFKEFVEREKEVQEALIDFLKRN